MERDKHTYDKEALALERTEDQRLHHYPFCNRIIPYEQAICVTCEETDYGRNVTE